MSLPTRNNPYNWMLVVAGLIIVAWAARSLYAPGIGISLWLTSAAMLLVVVLLFSWYTARRRGRRDVI